MQLHTFFHFFVSPGFERTNKTRFFPLFLFVAENVVCGGPLHHWGFPNEGSSIIAMKSSAFLASSYPFSSSTPPLPQKDSRGDQQLFDNCNIMVRSAVEAAHASDGVVGNVTGRTLTVVWNATKKCLRHSTTAATFAEELRKLKDFLQVGLATGQMLHGNVGSKTNRFATTFGMPLEAAEAMTDHARMFGVYCLYADCTTENRLQHDASLRTCIRLVDVWKDTQRLRTARIYEVHLTQLATAMQMWMGASEAEASNAPDLEHHTTVVNAAMNGEAGWSELRRLVEQSPEDNVLQVCFKITNHRLIISLGLFPPTIILLIQQKSTRKPLHS